MKYPLLIILALVTISKKTHSQKYFTKNGKTEFIGSVDTFEPVEAKNNSTTAILNTQNGDFASLLFITSFNFKVALMEEHFNENYMETEKFPKSTFKGSIINFKLEEITDKKIIKKISGILNIKGIEKKIETDIEINKINNTIYITGNFKVSPNDFNIKIPSVVENKISKNILIIFSYELVEKK